MASHFRGEMTMDSRPLDDFQGTERFAIRRRLGAGGMGIVYRAFDRDRGHEVAVKTLLMLDATSLYRFKNEFRSLADADHPNLVRLYELISAGDRWFFTMELIDGVDFLRYVRQDGPGAPIDPMVVEETQAWPSKGVDDPETTVGSDGRAGGDIPPTVEGAAVEPTLAFEAVGPADGAGASPALPHFGRLREALRQLAEGLHALHGMGKLHRDIKPSNVLVTGRGRVVLMDFGLATGVVGQEDGPTAQGVIVGTVGYMAPEQASGLPLTPAVDWYAVGVMLFRALTGRLPFVGRIFEVVMAKHSTDAPSPSSLAEGVPADLDALCVDLLRRCPEERPTYEEVIRRIGGEAPALAKPPSTAEGRPFVGRGPHLAALGGAFEAVRRGGTVSAFVHGRSGAGKSALVRRFLEGLAEEGDAVVLAGRCHERESVAYKALDSLIDALSRHLLRLDRAEVIGLMPRDAPALARVFPVLRRVGAVADAPRRAHEVPDQQELRRRAFAALRELLARLGDRSPLVLFIDDLQWGDLDSAALLSDLLGPPDPPSLLLLCCYRSEYAGASPCLARLLAPRDVSEAGGPERLDVAVDALTPEEGRALALMLLGRDDPSASERAATIAEEAGGNPYFLLELARHLAEGADAPGGTPDAGVSLDEMLWGRISRLPEGARALLETLAVAGGPLRQALACRAAGLGHEGFAALALLRGENLVRGSGPGALDDVETYHDRIREAVIHRLAPGVAEARHRTLAVELEAGGGADAETLAVHFEAAGEGIKAGRYYAHAAADAARSLAFDRAAKLYRRALEGRPAGDPEAPALRRELAEALANAGRGVEAARAYQEAARVAGPGEVLELERCAAYQLLISGHTDEGLDAMRGVLAHVGMTMPSTPRRALFRLLLARARLRLRGLRFRERSAEEVAPGLLSRIDVARSVAVGISVVDVICGSSFQTRSLLLSLRAGEPSRIALALGWEAVHSACLGLPARRRTAALTAAAVALASRIDDPHALGVAEVSAGAAGYLEGRFRAGVEASDRAAQVFRERCTGVVWELDTAQIFGLWSLIYEGRLGELSGRYHRLFKEARERGDRYMEATMGVYSGALARLAADEVDEARAQSNEAIGRWSRRGFHIQHLTSLYGNNYIDLYAGDAPSAWCRTEAQWPALRASLLLRIQHVRIDVKQHSGRCAVAAAAVSSDPRALLEHAEGYARGLDRERAPWSDALASLVRAGIASVRGDLPRASALLRVAIEGFDAADMGLFAASARRRLGVLTGGDEGRDLIVRADAWMHANGIRNPAKMVTCFAPGFPDE